RTACLRGATSDGGDLDQVAAGVVEHRGRQGTHLRGPLGEYHVEVTQPVVLGLHVVDGELDHGYPVDRQRLPVGRHRRINCGLEQQLDATWVIGRDDGDPSVLAYELVDLRHETER